jgi:hypothetical protein
LDTRVLAQELIDHCVVVQARLNLILDNRVLDFFVLLDDVLDLGDDALKGPLSEVCRHLHALLLARQLLVLYFLKEVAHLEHCGTSLSEAIKHFLREITIDSIFLEDGDLLG